MLAIFSPALADDVTDVDRLLCSASEVTVCFESSDCVDVMPWEPQSRLVKSGSSYLSQSELPVTFGVGRRDRVDRVIVTWPNGDTQEFTGVATGRAYDCVEGKGLSEQTR
jgi:hypothetical protein